MSTSRAQAGGEPAGPVNVALDATEWAFVRTLRDVPPSVLRDRMNGFVRELVCFVASPGCSSQQADGAPCETSSVSCDGCSRVLSVLEDLQTRLQRG